MNMTENNFSCKFCNQTYNTGPHLFTHLNATHYSAIKAKIDSGNFELVNFDCINANCKKLYGYKNHYLWCGLCITSFKRYSVVNAMKNKKSKYEFDEKHDILEEKKKDKLCYDMNLDLTQEFIILILQQVDELCENITNGDPDDQRTLEVNQNLNNAVSCYRTKLNGKFDPFGKIKVKEQKHSDKIGKNSKDNSIKVDRRFKKESKNKNSTKDYRLKDCDYSDIYENLNEETNNSDLSLKSSDSSGELSIKEELYEEILSKDDNNLHTKNLQTGICKICGKFLKSKLQRHIETVHEKKKPLKCLVESCESTFVDQCARRKHNENVHERVKASAKLNEENRKTFKIGNEALFPFINLSENDILHCSLCNYAKPLKFKGNMYRHLKLVHKNELKAKSEEGIDSDSIEQKFDCEKGICLKLYGPYHRKLWCLKCTEARSEVTRIGKTSMIHYL
jgi:hypothetical protein